MAERNYFTFGGYDSRDFGIYISGSGTFDAPERDYETAIVPGRNGALLMTMSRIDNIELEYPAYIYSDFSDRIAAMRSAFMGLEGYQRLTDSYHPDEYRLAYFEGDVSVKTTKKLDAGSFTLTFVCKPQRYLVDGENPVEIGQWGETTTVQGDVVTFDAPEGTGFKSLVVDIEPVQSGSGTPSPSNVRPITGWSGVNVYVSPTQDAQDATVYPVSFSSAGTVYGGTVDVMSGVLTVDRAIVDLGTLSWDTTTVYGVQVFRSSGINATIADSPEPLFDCYKSETTLSSLAQNNGSAMARTTYWSSSNTRMVIHDERYTTAADLKAALSGHFVCYKLATPQTYQLTPAEVEALLGKNCIWSDAGDVTVEYGIDPTCIVNPTQQTALPVIRVYGYGTLTVGSETITIAQHANAYIDIDCEIMDCYCGAVNCNSLVSFSSHEFPKLPAGVTHIAYSGNITKVEVTPNWWRT